MQSKKASAIETVAGLAIGFAISMAIGHFLYPAIGHQVSTGENAFITAVFTIASLIRGYFVRRGFNKLHQKGFLQ